MKVSGDVFRYLKNEAFVLVALPLDLGAGEETVLLVKTRRDFVEALREKNAPVRAAWSVENTGRGPVVCWLVRAEDPSVGDMVGEVFFDPADPDDVRMLDLLASQERVRVAFLDENLEPVWLADLDWDEVRRLEADQVRDRAQELLERAEDYDFEAAKGLFQEAHSLDALVERLFPEGPGG